VSFQGGTAASAPMGTPAAPAWVLMGGGRSQVQLFWARFCLEVREVQFSPPCKLLSSAGKRSSMRWVIVSMF